jgi:hypothetical protein
LTATVDTLQIPEPSTSSQSKAANTYALNGAFLTMVRRHFAQAGNIEVPELQHYTWSTDDKLSTILIEPVYNWKPNVIQQRPAVIVKRGPWKIGQLGIGNKYHGYPSVEGYDEENQLVQVMGTHSFFCIGTVGLEAEEIAMEVVYVLLCFSQVIREQFCLGKFLVSDIGPVSKLDECQDHFGVPVNVEYTTQWNWKLIRQAPIWARIGWKDISEG